MQLKAPLTKENFFNDMMGKYPKAMKMFCDWIDQYKKAINWNSLFHNQRVETDIDIITVCNIKFHDLPHAMQMGIWLEFAIQKNYPVLSSLDLRNYDLKQDIEITLQQIETGIPLPNPGEQS